MLARKARYRRSALAALLRVSVRTLDRYFQREYHQTAQEWLNGRRLLRANELLANGAPVKQAAFEVGFKQVSHFSRAFREQFGYPPSKVCAKAAGWLERGACERPAQSRSRRIRCG